ncbi:MAG: hypothetical protein HP497_12085 [Nitrospira sp.]|nr:hypothetical protein [Nitrospira sp.]
MATMNVKKSTIILGHAVVGWVLCGAVVWVGNALVGMEIALIAHAMAVPLIFAGVAWLYHKRFGYTTPTQTAFMFLTVVVLLDVFLVALLIERSFAMFRSIIGTWIPFALIFAATYLTGRVLQSPNKADAEQKTSGR